MPQLAKLIRDKHPGAYDDLSDEDLEKSVLDKHPEYKDLVTDYKKEEKSSDEVIDEAKKPLISEKSDDFNKEQTRKLDVLKAANAKPLNEPTTFMGGVGKSLTDSLKFNPNDLVSLLRSAAHPGLDYDTGEQKSKIDTIKDILPLLVSSGLEGTGQLRGKLNEVGDSASKKLPEKSKLIELTSSSSKPRYRINTDGTYTNMETGETNPINFKTNNEPTTPNKAAIDEPTLGKQAAAYNSEELAQKRGTEEDVPDNPKARALEEDRRAASPELEQYQNYKRIELQANRKPLGYRDWTDNPPQINKTLMFNPKTLKGMTGDIQDSIKPEESLTSKFINDESGEMKLPDANSLTKGPNPDANVINDPKTKPNLASEILNLPRAMQIGNLHFSAPLRQGLPLITSKSWWTSWSDMFKAYGSQKASDAIDAQIRSHPNFQSLNGEQSFADRAGLKLTNDFSQREELLGSKLAEAIPGMKASNRAFKTYLNVLRSDTFNSLIEDATKSGLNPRSDIPLSQEIARFVNNATGRGDLGSLEKHAGFLNAALFAPRKIAANLQILNPANYMMGNPMVRKQYLKAFLSTAGAWTTFASVAKLAGAEVNLDPTNSDFGKIKIGNTRLDPAGGFQQYLVAATRLITGKETSSTSGKTTELGAKFGALTRKDVTENLFANKLNTPVKFAYDLLNASKGRSINLPDSVARMFIPIIAQDVIELAKEDPRLIPAAIPSMFGMSGQTYGPKGQRNSILPEEMSYKIPQ